MNNNVSDIDELMKKCKNDPNSWFADREFLRMSTEHSQVARFYNGKSILITGGTGLLGKLLVEKLLRSCNGLDKIFLIIRAKRGKSVDERKSQILENRVFSHLRRENFPLNERVLAVEGDLSKPNLGLEPEDIERLQKEVNIIFHVAALLNFKASLTECAKPNVRATKDLLSLARRCKNLTSFVYVSTAFSYCVQENIEETVGNIPYQVDDILNLIDADHDPIQNDKSYIGKWPNTYAFTKAIAEHLVLDHSHQLPVCIFRPAIVTNTHEEPLKGWIDNYNGAVGVVAGVIAGVSHCFHVDSKKSAEIVPADFVVNGIIVAASRNMQNRNDKMKIYNYASSPQNRISYGELYRISIAYGRKFPTSKLVWYPTALLCGNYFTFFLCVLLLQVLPACAVDLYKIMQKQEFRFRTLTTFFFIHKVAKYLSFFSTREWNYSNKNVIRLWDDMSELDRKLFNFNLSKDNFNWNEYILRMCIGIRVFLLRDDLATIDEGRKKYSRLLFQHRSLQLCLLLLGTATGFWIYNRLF